MHAHSLPLFPAGVQSAEKSFIEYHLFLPHHPANIS